jgi:hypothetical protein
MNSAWAQIGSQSTVGSVVLTLLAGGAMLAPGFGKAPREIEEKNSQRPWSTVGSVPTSATAKISAVVEQPLASVLTDAINRAAKQQIRLEPDMAAIVAANLWDLYES